MAKYLSGRVRRISQDRLSNDRYKYLELDQAEPNLGDPSATSPNLPAGTQYQLISIIDNPGERYWIPVGGGLVPGSLTIYDEDYLVGGISSTTQLNFVGAAITASSDTLKETTLTLRDSKIYSFSLNEKITQDNNTAFGFVKYATEQVGFVTLTNVSGAFDVYPGAGSENGQLIVDGTGIGLTPSAKTTSNITNVLTNIEVTPEYVSSNKEFLFNNNGEFKGASNLIYDNANDRVGINSTEPGHELDVRGTIRATNYIGTIEEASKLSTPRTFSIDGHDANSLLRETVTKTVSFNQTTSTIAINTTGINVGDYIVPITSVIELGTIVDTISANEINLNKPTLNPTTENSRDLTFAVAHQAGEVIAIGKTFDGQGNVVLVGKLKSIDGLTAGEYGSATQIPVLNVNNQGIVTSISTQNVNFSSATVGNAVKIQTQSSDTDSLHHITFVDSNNTSTGTYEDVKTDSEFVFNPSSNTIGIATNNPLQRLQVGPSTLDNQATKSGITENSGVTQVGINTDDLEVNYIILPITNKIDEGTFIESIEENQITLNQATAGALDNDSLEFVTVNNTDVFTIDSSGQVGIGTTEPKTKLDVYGNATISGLTSSTTLTVTGDAQFYSEVKIGTGVTISSGVITATDFVGIGSSSRTTRVEVLSAATGTDYQTSRFLFIKNGVTHNSFTTPFTENGNGTPYYNTESNTIHGDIEFITSRGFKIDGLDANSNLTTVAEQQAQNIAAESSTISITTDDIEVGHYVHPVNGIISLGTKVTDVDTVNGEITISPSTLNSTGQNNVDLVFGNIFGAGEVTSPEVQYNNSGDITLVGKLRDVDGLTAGEYGSASVIPIINVNSQGIVTSISTQNVNLNITTVSQANTVKTQTSDQNTIQHLTFVEDDNADSTSYESVRTDPELVFQPNTNSIGIATNNPLQRLQVGPSTLDIQQTKSGLTIEIQSNTIGLVTTGLKIGQTVIPVENVIDQDTFIESIASSNGGQITLSKDTLNAAQVTNQDLQFADVNNTDVFTIDSSGQVGIGTTEPKTKLDVYGNTSIEGTATVSGNTTINANLDVSNFTSTNLLAVGHNNPFQSADVTIKSSYPKLVLVNDTDNTLNSGEIRFYDSTANLSGAFIKHKGRGETVTKTSNGASSGNVIGINTDNLEVGYLVFPITDKIDDGTTIQNIASSNGGQITLNKNILGPISNTDQLEFASPYSDLIIGTKSTHSANDTDAIIIAANSDDVNGIELNRNIKLGNADSRDLVVTAKVNSNVIPKNDSGSQAQYNLGSTSNKWNHVYAENVTTTNLSVTTFTANSATNLAGGAKGEIPYQSSADSTDFLSVTTNDNYVLTFNTATGLPEWDDVSNSLADFTAPKSNKVKVTKGASNSDAKYLTFVDSNNSTGAQENILTDAGIAFRTLDNHFSINGTTSNTDTIGDGGHWGLSERFSVNSIITSSGVSKDVTTTQNAGATITGINTAGVEVGDYIRPIYSDGTWIIESGTRVDTIGTGNLTLSKNHGGFTASGASPITFVSEKLNYENVFVVTDSGNVAIGTSPYENSTEDLIVGGDVKIHGNLDIDGTITGSIGLADDLKINGTNQILYQESNNTTNVLSHATNTNYLLTSGDANNAPSWVDPGTLSVSSATDATNADKVAITAKTDNTDYWVHFGSATTGDDDVNIGNANGKELKFNPGTGTLTATTFSGAYSGNATTASNLNLGANTTNELVLQTGNNTTSTLNNGSNAGYLLKTNANAVAPSWVNPATLSVFSATYSDHVEVRTLGSSYTANEDHQITFNLGTNTTASNEDIYNATDLHYNPYTDRLGIKVGRIHTTTFDHDTNSNVFRTSGRLHINQIELSSSITKNNVDVTAGTNIIDLSGHGGSTGITLGMYVRPVFYHSSMVIQDDTKVIGVNLDGNDTVRLSRNVTYTRTLVDLVFGTPDYDEAFLVTDSGNVAISTSPFGDNGNGTEPYKLGVGGNVRINGNLDVTGTFNANISGNSGSTDEVKTIEKADDTTTYLTFVADHNTSSTAESLHTNSGLLFDSQNQKLGISTNLTPSYVNARNLGLHAKDFEFTAGTVDLDSFDVTDDSYNFKVVEYMVWFEAGSKIQAGKVLIMQNGGTPYIQEFAIMYEPSRIANLTAVKVNDEVKLRATMESGISGTIKCKWSRSSLL